MSATVRLILMETVAGMGGLHRAKTMSVNTQKPTANNRTRRSFQSRTRKKGNVHAIRVSTTKANPIKATDGGPAFARPVRLGDLRITAVPKMVKVTAAITP